MDERRDDWHNNVDKNLMSLNTAQLAAQEAQRATDKELDDLDLLSQKHDRIILGDPESGRIGVSAQVDAQDILINELRAEIRSLKAVIYGDHAGNAGLETRTEKLEDKKKWKERREGWAWDSFTKIAVELLLVLAMLLLNWERIEDLIKAKLHPAAPAASVDTKHRHKKKPKPIVMPEIEGEPAAEDVH